MGRREWYHKGSSSSTATTGCMSGMLNFFDFHQLLFTTTNNESNKNDAPSISLDSLPEVHSGLEAPRNSLEELNEEEEEEEEYFDVPVGVKINQEPAAVLTRREKMEFYLEEERKSSSSSQAVTPRTPSVVARLMGLDLLPERPSSYSCSLPVTPVAPVITKRLKNKKREFDNVRKPLRSLNCNVDGSRSLPDSPRTSSAARKSFDVEPRLSLQLNKENVSDCKTPSSKSGNYAREIVKQVKESIMSNRRDATLGIASDESAGIKSRRTRTCERSTNKSSKSPTTSSIFSNHNIKFQKPPVKPTRSPPPPPPPPPPPRLDIKKPNIKPRKFEKKTGYERFARNLMKKSKTKETQKAAQIKVNQDFELKYIRTVLEHADLLSGSLKKHTNSNPIDPVLFHLLELKLPPDQDCTGPFRNRWNRKLLFHLVVEIAGELGQCRSFATKTTESLYDQIAKQINSYPGANCRVLGDIDALIDGDLPERNVRRLLKHPAVEMEMVEIMEEIEGDIVEEIIGEMMVMMT